MTRGLQSIINQYNIMCNTRRNEFAWLLTYCMGSRLKYTVRCGSGGGVMMMRRLDEGWLIRPPISKKKNKKKKKESGVIQEKKGWCSPVNAVQDDRMDLLFLCLERESECHSICDLFLPLFAWGLRRFFAPPLRFLCKKVQIYCTIEEKEIINKVKLIITNLLLQITTVWDQKKQDPQKKWEKYDVPMIVSFIRKIPLVIYKK